MSATEIEARDPATGERIQTYAAHGPAEVEHRLAAAAEALARWRRAPLGERTRPLVAAAAILEGRAAEWAELMAREMGKPVKQGRAEATKCARVLRHYAEQAERMLAPQPAAVDEGRAYVRLDPLGTILAVMPWNFPFWQLFRCAAPMLAAGNTVLLKHATNVPGCALAIERIFREAGLPSGVFSTLLVGSREVAAVVADRRVHGVTLTGSEKAGAEVAAQAGRHLKKTVLELGGSDPFIVLADADLERAIEVASTARVQNTGQSCIAAKRFIVERAVSERFVAGLRRRLEALRVGSPLDEATELGPLARPDLRDTLHAQVEKSVAAGARLITGGQVPAGPGAFYPATLLTDCGPGIAAWDEETFGPVAAVHVVDSADAAVDAANGSDFGLGASLWSRDLARAEQLAARIEAGCVFVNGMVKSDPLVPFGGVKRSGYGRELGRWGVEEWVNVKTVWVTAAAAAGSARAPGGPASP